MYRIKRCTFVAALLLFAATPSLAADNAATTLLRDTFVGALSGGLVGVAILAFTNHPTQHFDTIGYGAAGGAVVGATYGAFSISRSLAELEHGKVKFAMPTIMPELKASPRGPSSVMMTAQLFRGKF